MGSTLQRRLAAILAVDVVGFSRLAGTDEDRTLARLRTLRSDVFDPTIAIHNGRVIKRTGDGAIVEFRSVVDAVRCAVEVQSAMIERNAGVQPDSRIDLRIGIHLGDVVEESDGDLMGDGVNIAARLEGVAESGGICLSEDAYRQVKTRLQHSIRDLGETRLKNIAEPMRIYALNLGPPHPDNPATPPAMKGQTNAGRNLRMGVAAAIMLALASGGLAVWAGLLGRSSGPEDLTAGTHSESLADAPAIVVLPFTNVSGDASMDYFADGVTETMTTSLSRSPEIRVVARTSAETYKGKSVDVRQIGRELGVRYALEGSVQKGADRVRIVAQLIDTLTGDHVWAERYEGEGTDAFALQDEVAEKVLGSVAGRHGLIRKNEYEQAWGKDAANLDEYDYFLRAHQLVSTFTEETTRKAAPILEEGLKRFPKSGLLHIQTAWMHYQLFYGGWSDDPADDLKIAYDLAVEALAEPNVTPMVNLEGHFMKAWLEVYHKNDWDQAMREREIVLALNPNEASAVNVMAMLAIGAGEPDAAIDSLMRPNISWDPSYVFTTQQFPLGTAYFVKGEYETALEHLLQEKTRDPLYTLTMLAATYAELGRIDEAHGAVKEILTGNPDVTLAMENSVNPFRNKADSDRFLNALRKAGLPES